MKSDYPFDPRHPAEQAPAGSKLHPVDWVVESDAVGDVLREMNGQLHRRHRRRLRVVTGGAVALLLSGFVWQQAYRSTTITERTSTPSAMVSRPERQVLPDGSIVELRNGAQVAVAFTDSVRRVVLTRGEAHFQVLTQKAKPFVVAVGDVEVRAVGTAFSVELGGTEVAVLVTEGSVAVEKASSESAEPAGTDSPNTDKARAVVALVEAGNRVVVPVDTAATSDSRPEVVPVETAELAMRLAWRAPRLEFSRTPLVEALALMSQHAAAGKNVTVILADPSLGRVQVSGVLRADNMETLLGLLDDEHGIKAEYRSPKEVVLRKGQ
ncbi:MAG: FecR domain-containing protein [Opitutaceae bacterium]|nr:FecR domain-containing protein [Opitutaceae bacterium]